MEFREELKKEYRKADSWFGQFGNVIQSIILGFVTWVSLMAMMSGPLALILLWSLEWSPEGQQQLKDIGIHLFEVIGGLSAMLVIGFNLPKRLRNVFWENAERRVTAYEEAERKFKSDVETVELVLRKHGFIK